MSFSHCGTPRAAGKGAGRIEGSAAWNSKRLRVMTPPAYTVPRPGFMTEAARPDNMDEDGRSPALPAAARAARFPRRRGGARARHDGDVLGGDDASRGAAPARRGGTVAAARRGGRGRPPAH